MARVFIDRQYMPGISVPSAFVLAPTLTAGDTSNGNSFYAAGGEILLLEGTGTVTLKSSADALGRTGDITVTLAGVPKLVGPLTQQGFLQADSKFWLDCSGSVSIALISTAR